MAARYYKLVIFGPDNMVVRKYTFSDQRDGMREIEKVFDQYRMGVLGLPRGSRWELRATSVVKAGKF